MHFNTSEATHREQNGAWPHDQGDDFASNQAPVSSFGSYGGFGPGETLLDPAVILAEEPLATGETEPFPVQVLPPLLAEAAREFSRAAMVPESMASTAILGCVSAAPGAGLEVVTYGEKRTRPNMFLLVIARTGIGKDESMKLASGPLEQDDAECLARWQREKKPKLQAEFRRLEQAIKDKTSATGRAKRQEGNDDRSLEELERRRLEIEHDLRAEPAIIVKNATKEALEDLIRFQPGEALASISAESRGIVDVLTGRYSNGKSTDEDFYTCGFSGTPCKINRKGRDRETIRLNRPCLALVWMLQPRSFRQDLLESDKMVDSGLLGRFLLHEVIQGPPQIPENQPPLSKGIMDRWAMLLRGLTQLRAEQHVIHANDAAREVLRTFDNENRRRLGPGGDLEDIAEFAVRRGEIAWKLALTLHCGSHGGASQRFELACDTAEAAVEIIRWYSRQAEKVLQANRDSRLSKSLADLTHLVTSHGGEITFRELRKSHGVEEHEIARLVQRSQRRLEIIERQNPHGGPRSRLLRLRQNSQDSQNPQG